MKLKLISSFSFLLLNPHRVRPSAGLSKRGRSVSLTITPPQHESASTVRCEVPLSSHLIWNSINCRSVKVAHSSPSRRCSLREAEGEEALCDLTGVEISPTDNGPHSTTLSDGPGIVINLWKLTDRTPQNRFYFVRYMEVHNLYSDTDRTSIGGESGEREAQLPEKYKESVSVGSCFFYALPSLTLECAKLSLETWDWHWRVTSPSCWSSGAWPCSAASAASRPGPRTAPATSSGKRTCNYTWGSETEDSFELASKLEG